MPQTVSMKAMRVVHISDPHLSRRNSFFHHNWEILLATLNASPPDLIVCTGDMSYNGAEHDDDITFAAEQFKRLTTQVVCVPGNHDLGNSVPDVRGGETLINDVRRNRYLKAFGADFWVRDIPGWRLVGINSMLLGSGLDAEAEQNNLLENTINTADTRGLMLFMHKPLYVSTPEETELTQSAIYPEHRHALYDLLSRPSLTIVATGHLHAYRTRKWKTIEEIWNSSTAFVIDAPAKIRPPDGIRQVGYLEHLLAPDQSSHRFVEPDRFLNIDVGNWLTAPEGFHKRYSTEAHLGLAEK